MHTLFIKRLLVVAVAAATVALTLTAAGKGKKDDENSDKTITAKVWYKDGTVYEGPLLKHWRTRRQGYLASGHNFHTAPSDGGDKSVKHETRDTDSILITSSTHPDFKAGDFYIAYNGKGRPALHKMLLCTDRGRHADICRLPYWGNCSRGMMQLDQGMEYWYIRLRDKPDRVYLFFDNAIQNGCNKSTSCLGPLRRELEKDGMSGLADAIQARFSPDKDTSKESARLIGENPRILLDFIDSYLDSAAK